MRGKQGPFRKIRILGMFLKPSFRFLNEWLLQCVWDQYLPNSGQRPYLDGGQILASVSGQSLKDLTDCYVRYLRSQGRAFTALWQSLCFSWSLHAAQSSLPQFTLHFYWPGLKVALFSDCCTKLQPFPLSFRQELSKAERNCQFIKRTVVLGKC